MKKYFLLALYIFWNINNTFCMDVLLIEKNEVFQKQTRKATSTLCYNIWPLQNKRMRLLNSQKNKDNVHNNDLVPLYDPYPLIDKKIKLFKIINTPFYMFSSKDEEDRSEDPKLNKIISVKIYDINKYFLTLVSWELDCKSLKEKRDLKELRRRLLRTLSVHSSYFPDSFTSPTVDVDINMSLATFVFVNQRCDYARNYKTPNLEIRPFRALRFIGVSLEYIDSKLYYMKGCAFNKLFDLLNRAIFLCTWIRKESEFSGNFSDSVVHIPTSLYSKLARCDSKFFLYDL